MLKPMFHKCDVLVIGGGFSGAWSALSAAEHAKSVLIVDKGSRDWRGLGMMSGGDMGVVPCECSVDDFLEELVYYYDGLCDQPFARMVLEQSYARFSDLERWGHKFARNPDGSMRYILQRDLKLIRYYYYHPYGKGGPHTCDTLYDQLEQRGARRLSNVQIVDLIKEDGDSGRVTGAVGFHTRSGMPVVIQAGAVILCTNTGGFKMSYLGNTAVGEGAVLGFRAGAEFRSMEFLQNWTCPRAFAWEGQTGMLPYGARFVNSEGRDFMREYSPIHGAKSDPHYNIRGMALEAREGRAPLWFDTSTMSPEGVEAMTPTGGWMLLNDQKLKALGIDFFKSRTEWMPQFQYIFGGMVTDLQCRTRVPGLYAAGRAASLHTGVYMGGWDTCMTSTTGYVAGAAAAKEAMNLDRSVPFDKGQALERLAPALDLMERPGIAPKDIVRAVQELMVPADVSVLKTGQGLSRSLQKLEYVRDNLLPEMAAADPHYLLKAMEARGMTLVAEMYLRASLMRKESRCGHFREDYPTRDGDPAWIHIDRHNGRMRLRFHRVPVETYQFRPHRYYMDDFNYPDQPKSVPSGTMEASHA
ncbi:MAG: FAD-binding protein [Desulfovibrionaceae bacterium]|nr:FAD-binding protein [Desulfovibrionaceae bacterium]